MAIDGKFVAEGEGGSLHYLLQFLQSNNPLPQDSSVLKKLKNVSHGDLSDNGLSPQEVKTFIAHLESTRSSGKASCGHQALLQVWLEDLEASRDAGFAFFQSYPKPETKVPSPLNKNPEVIALAKQQISSSIADAGKWLQGDVVAFSDLNKEPNAPFVLLLLDTNFPKDQAPISKLFATKLQPQGFRVVFSHNIAPNPEANKPFEVCEEVYKQGKANTPTLASLEGQPAALALNYYFGEKVHVYGTSFDAARAVFTGDLNFDRLHNGISNVGRGFTEIARQAMNVEAVKKSVFIVSYDQASFLQDSLREKGFNFITLDPHKGQKKDARVVEDVRTLYSLSHCSDNSIALR